MTKYLPALFLPAFVATSLAAQQVPAVHRWAPIVVRQDVRLDLDTSSVGSTDHQRRVWLRWTLPTGVPEYASIEVEERYVDCARAQTRLLAGQDITIDNGTGRAETRFLDGQDVNISSGALRLPTPKASSGLDSTWHHPTQGSLLAEAVEAVCRWAEAGA